MISSISGSTGGMSPSYIAQMQDRMFKAMDSNSDGKVDKEEMTQFQTNAPQGGPPPGAPRVDELYSKTDEDGDGALSKLEFEAGLAKLSQEMQEKRLESGSSSEKSEKVFNTIDSNGDGKVDKEEMEVFQANGPQGGPPPGGPRPIGPPPGGEGSTLEEMFSELDSDRDGSISKSEFTTAMEKMRETSSASSEPQTASINDTLTDARVDESSSSSTKSASAADGYDFDLKQLLSEAVNCYMKSYSSSHAQSNGSSSLMSSYA